MTTFNTEVLTGKIIHVRVREVYGSRLVYPVCDLAKALCELTGAKTLTPAALRVIRERLGLAVEVVGEKI